MPALIRKLKPEGLKSPKSFSTQEDVMSAYLEEIQKKIGKNPPEEKLYAYHNLGYPSFKKLKNAKDNQLVQNVLSKKVVDANKKLYKNKTKKETFEQIRKLLNADDYKKREN
jgi:hypothetical protein